MRKAKRCITIEEDAMFNRLKVFMPADLVDVFIKRFNKRYADKKMPEWAKGYCKKEKGYLVVCAPRGRGDNNIWFFIKKFSEMSEIWLCDKTYFL